MGGSGIGPVPLEPGVGAVGVHVPFEAGVADLVEGGLEGEVEFLVVWVVVWGPDREAACAGLSGPCGAGGFAWPDVQRVVIEVVHLGAVHGMIS